MKANYQSNRYRLEDRLMRTFPEEIRMQESSIAGYQADMRTLETHPLPEDKERFVGMELLGKSITSKEEAGALLLEAIKAAPQGNEEMQIGKYRGLEVSVHYDVFRSQYMLSLRGSMTHTVEMGQDARGNLIRIENALNGIPARLDKAKGQLSNLQQQMAAAKEEIARPFPQEEELKVKSARLAELDAALNMDRPKIPYQTEQQERPSVREALKRPCRHGQPTQSNNREEVR